MKRLLQWWRTKVHWFWRWTVYIELLIGLFYLVEDVRGSIAWKSFTKENPQFAITDEDRSTYQTPLTEVPGVDGFVEPLQAYESRDFRMRFFEQRNWRNRKLNFPIVPFRRSDNWKVSSLFNQDYTEPEAARWVLEIDDVLTELTDQYSNTSDQEFLFQVIRIQLIRANCFWQLQEYAKAQSTLSDAARLLGVLNNGQSIDRGNYATDDVMHILQLTWQALHSEEAISKVGLKDWQSMLEQINFQQKAKQSEISWGKAECVALDNYKWSIETRTKPLLQACENIAAGGSFADVLHAGYLLLMPNGWIDHNKINICRLAQVPSSSTHPATSRWQPTQVLLTEPDSKIDARPTEAYVRCAVVAVALERYKVEKGGYPDQLSQLVPEFLDKVPNDPFLTENELVYRIEADHPVIYSLGPNKADDEGKPRAPIAHGDLVWRYALPEAFDYEDYIVY